MCNERTHERYNIHEYFLKFKQLHPHLFYINKDSKDIIMYNIKLLQIALLNKYYDNTEENNYKLISEYNDFLIKINNVNNIYETLLEDMKITINRNKNNDLFKIIDNTLNDINKHE